MPTRFFTGVRTGILASIAAASLAFGAPFAFAQSNTGPAPASGTGGSNEATAIPNFCVYRCDTGQPSTSDSDEYSKWHAQEVALDRCEATCQSTCEETCGAQTVQAPASGTGGAGSGSGGSRRRGQTAQNTPSRPNVARCSINTPSNGGLGARCTDHNFYTTTNPRTSDLQPGLCLFRCPGSAEWTSIVTPAHCTAQICNVNCQNVCGTQTCGTDVSCQPLPERGTPTFLQGTDAAASTAAAAAPPAAPALRAGNVGAYGLKDPLGGVTVQRLIAGIITYVLGFVGALFFGMFVYGGLLWMTSGGEMERVKSGKATLVNAVIGMAIVLASYTIVFLILQLPNLFTQAA